jgi:cell division protein ZapA (FtsZ GTPase activity inhibitor)
MPELLIAGRHFQLPLERLSLLDPQTLSMKLNARLSARKKTCASDLSKYLLLTALELAAEAPSDPAPASANRIPVIVKIAGRSLPVASEDHSTEEVLAAAARVDAEVACLRTEFDTQDAIQLALLTALSFLNRSERRGERRGDDLAKTLARLSKPKTLGPILLYGRIKSLHQTGGVVENAIGAIAFFLRLGAGFPMGEPLAVGADAELYGRLKAAPSKLEFAASRARVVTTRPISSRP